MLKVTIKGEVYPFDQRYPLHEAIEVEEQAGMTFGAFQQSLQAGSAKAIAVFMWVVLRRNGRDVKLADILSGEFEVDVDEVDVEPEDGGEPPGPPSSPPTGGGGSARSLKSSATPPPKSGHSPSTSSTT